MKQLQAIEDEAEYLSTLSNVQWLIYPFFKFFERIVEKTCGCCKNEKGRIPHPNAKVKPNKYKE